MTRCSLQVIVPTFNRSSFLPGCVRSVFAAKPPQSMEWSLTIADNNSSDDTSEVSEQLIRIYGNRLRYQLVKRPGKSAALNEVIRSGSSEILGFIDDDEVICDDWLRVIESWLEGPGLDFIGGPYFGDWKANKPAWLPAEYAGVLSADDPDSIPKEPTSFDDERLFLRGGNAVLRRRVFDVVGLYDENLGRRGKRLTSCEDQEFLMRLKRFGLRGMYVPSLFVYHLVSPERVSKTYFRRWAWDRSLSLSVLAAKESGRRPGKIPRYLIGNALAKTKCLARGSAAERFSAELDWITLAGLFWGTYTRKWESDLD